jgi:hypothetical protein
MTPGGLTTSPEPVPVAFLGRTSTLAMQDPAASLRRQLREVVAKLPPGWFVAAHYWDIESGGLDLAQRGHGTAHQHVDAGIPRDGGLADLLKAAASPAPGFAAVVCEDIERSARDTFNALKLEKKLAAAGVPLFATDEHIDVAGANATTVLVRRVKQGMAEWFRLQIKEKAWRGLREHALDGWNTGTPPYGYQAERMPHPNPAKASQGRFKTRLIPDPPRAAVVEQMFTWRAHDKAGITTIAARLNADPAACPPPAQAGAWTPNAVYQLLANPKYTGHMVWNRTSKRSGRKRPLPPDQWIWSPAPVHPPVISRELYDAAQQVTLNRASIAGDAAAPAHPLAQTSYELRSRIRHRACKRRMQGSTRASGVYYCCPHSVTNPRHTAASPDHPRSVIVREDTLIPLVCQFISHRVLGPERAAHLAQQLPPNAAEEADRVQQQRAALASEIQRLDAAQASQIRELDTLTADPADRAAQAMRARIRDHFAELITQRDYAETRLAALGHDTSQAPDPALLDALPIMTPSLDNPRRRAALYQALDIQLLYSKQPRQVTIRATVTSHTPAALAALTNDSQPPGTGSHFPVTPIGG